MSLMENLPTRPAASRSDDIAEFRFDDFDDIQAARGYVAKFNLAPLLAALEVDAVQDAAVSSAKPPAAFEEKPFEPKHADLARLHFLCMSRKPLSVLEFGSGFSTAIMADAMRRLHAEYAPWAKQNLRNPLPFHVHAVEEEHRFVEITRRRLTGGLDRFATVAHSSVEACLHDNRLATVYSKLPNVAPDFIYLDGPSQYATAQEINGLSLAHPARMPMSADILRLEFLLEPGALILVDGRTANARFLKSYLRRDWTYRHMPAGDVHLFELQEAPFGKYNQRKIDFCLGGKWLLN